MIRMYSDQWIRQGFTKTKRISLAGNEIEYNIWMNHEKEPVGIGVHFEVADDVHYEMTYDSWMDFLHKELRMGQEMCNLNIPSYFTGKTWMDFENRLLVNGITFKKFHF